MNETNTDASGVYVDPANSEPYVPVPVTIKSMMEAGAHFGHQTERWNPRMLPYIFGVRNNVHIINLDITLKNWDRARKFVADVSARGGTLLMVGTKNQARDIVRANAQRSAAFYVTSRWLGGTLTNFQTIKNSIDRMKKLEDLLVQAADENSKIKLNKKEKLFISRELEKLEINLGGIRGMKKAPDVIFVVDVIKEEIAVAEARKLHIPVIALVDTNTDPNVVSFPIPANDDSTKTIQLLTAGIADAILEGRSALEAEISKGREASQASEKENNGHNGKRSSSEDSEGAVPSGEVM